MLTSLGQLAKGGALHFSDGYRTKQSELSRSGFRILRAGDIQSGSPAFDSPDFVGLEREHAIGSKLVQPGDVVLTTKGTVGRTAYVRTVPEPAVYSPQLCFFRTAPEVISPRYLYFWFSGRHFTHQASSLQSSTDMAPYLSLAQLSGVKIVLPPLPEQQAIAEVLGALDDKIAANAKLVQASHSLVESLHLRSLVHAERRVTYADIAEVGGGATPSTKEPTYWNGDICWAAPSDITALDAPYLEDTPRHITATGLAHSSPLYPVGSILMTSRATIGAFAIATVPTAVNQGFIVVQPHVEHARWWLFHEMRRRVPEYMARANGATFLELPRSAFKAMALNIPEAQVLRNFDHHATRLHAVALSATRESRTLAQLRDTLLPALMDGTLRIKDAITQVEEAL